MSELYVNCQFVLYVNCHFMLYINCKEEVGITFSPCHKEGRSDVYPYTSNVRNWHGLECIKVKDIDSDMARQHGRQKLQAPTQMIKSWT